MAESTLDRDAQQEVTNTLQAFCDAMASKNAAAIDRLVHGNYIAVDPDGSVSGKKDLLDSLSGQGPGPDPNIFKLSEVTVKVTAETGAAVGVSKMKVQAGGQEQLQPYRLTVTFASLAAGWQAVLLTGTSMEPGGGGSWG